MISLQKLKYIQMCESFVKYIQNKVVDRNAVTVTEIIFYTEIQIVILLNGMTFGSLLRETTKIETDQKYVLDRKGNFHCFRARRRTYSEQFSKLGLQQAILSQM
ncbi:Hypothetical_protein [Hexamita inflata]|uniref:Hypothetical_protein n=1 Tax=Hexamita inflata TaxID=28002 RepID=A0AA86RAP6_9EUKA|nr:Hypothetical protein HINF_LOCUS61580 [Hexamita inflata]